MGHFVWSRKSYDVILSDPLCMLIKLTLCKRGGRTGERLKNKKGFNVFVEKSLKTFFFLPGITNLKEMSQSAFVRV